MDTSFFTDEADEHEYQQAAALLQEAADRAQSLIQELGSLCKHAESKLRQLQARNAPAMCDRIKALSDRKRVYPAPKDNKEVAVQAIVLVPRPKS